MNFSVPPFRGFCNDETDDCGTGIMPTLPIDPFEKPKMQAM
jgi:hypothetical protein